MKIWQACQNLSALMLIPLMLAIDSGNTYCKYAINSPDGIQEKSESKFGLPVFHSFHSVISFSPNEIQAGLAALNNAFWNPNGTIFDLRLLLGREFTDPVITERMKSWKHKVQQGEDGGIIINIGNDQEIQKLPYEAYGEFLKFVNHHLQINYPKDVVMTIPADSNLQQQIDIIRAAEYSGLNVSRLIPEPIAAAVGCGYTDTEPKQILVADFGGSSFVVTLINISRGSFHVVSTDSDPNLGGRNVDTLLMNKYIDTMKVEKEVEGRPEYAHMVRMQAEHTKRKLSKENTWLMQCDINKEVKSMQVSRNELIEFYSPEKMAAIERVLHKANVSKDDIDEVLLVGGASSTPGIQETLQKLFGNKLRYSDDPFTSVVKGAAMIATEFAKNEINITELDLMYETILPGAPVAPQEKPKDLTKLVVPMCILFLWATGLVDVLANLI